MAATIKCENAQKQEIKEILLRELGRMMDSIQEDEDSISVMETEDGLKVEYPIGEIYGYTSDYVQAIPYVFEKLKTRYPEIEIWGLAYEYETRVECTFGPLFYCKSTDKKLTVNYENWQECAQCGEIVERDVIYNSSQRDNGGTEGNLLCLCCPTCMLEYALDDEAYGEVEPNASLSDEEYDMVDEDEDALKSILWERIAESLDEPEYLEDFAKNRERIEMLLEKDLDTEKKDLLMQLLDNILDAE